MSNFLTREDFLSTQDIAVKELTIPDEIPVWGGKKICIRQLNRGEQDEYLKLQFGSVRTKQPAARGSREIEMGGLSSMYGHDAWLCVRGTCNQEGARIFQVSDIEKLKEKNGQLIGWIAAEIVKFSGMGKDLEEAAKVEEQLKN